MACSETVRLARPVAVCALVGLIAAGACSPRAASPPFAPAGGGAQPMKRALFPYASAGKIAHVVIIMQENRSFDNLFQGYPGADTVSSGLNSKGKVIALQPIALEAGYDIDHTAGAFFAAWDNGKMDGFDLEYSQGPGPNSQYGYVPRAEVQPYFNVAGQYVLADRMFTSHIDASFISHQYIIAGQANHEVNLPSGRWGCRGGGGDLVQTLLQNRQYGPSQSPCQDYQTLGDELTTAGLSWRFYAESVNGSDSGSIWSSYQAVKHIRNTGQWKLHVFSPPGRFITDIGRGTLAAVTWVMPSRANSDHPDAGSNTGPAWITSLVNAIGQSQFWDTTAIFLLWDDWGGWYDHVPPPQLDYDGLGIRVPLVVISPYAKANHVSHVQYETGSILRFAEDTFGLPQLAASDARANDPAGDCFDFTQSPRPYSPFASTYRPSTFIHEHPTFAPPDAE
jgi:phospholipase C